jgi:hypothetical protein
MDLMKLAQETAEKIETATAAGQIAASIHIQRALEKAVKDAVESHERREVMRNWSSR